MTPVPHSRRKRRVFVDSSAYLALLDQDDEHHASSAAILSRLVQGRYYQFITNVLIIEAHALLLSSVGAAQARSFLKAMRTSDTTVIRVRSQDEEAAQKIIFTYADKDFSFADAISFTVMQRLGIRYAFTFDQHFSQFGMIVLSHDFP